jgi:hypothetical protein
MKSNSYRNTWEIYTKSWSVADESKRLQLFEQCLSSDCVYTDPIAQVSGYEQLSGYMSELQTRIPGVAFVTTDFKTHHNYSLTHWNMLDSEGHILSQGASYGLYSADGRLMQMTGFFELPNEG